jgi:hypothetical protein
MKSHMHNNLKISFVITGVVVFLLFLAPLSKSVFAQSSVDNTDSFYNNGNTSSDFTAPAVNSVTSGTSNDTTDTGSEKESYYNDNSDTSSDSSNPAVNSVTSGTSNGTTNTAGNTATPNTNTANTAGNTATPAATTVTPSSSSINTAGIPNSTAVTPLTDPLGSDITVSGIILKFMQIATYLAVILGVLALVYVGLQFVLARGNSEELKTRKMQLLYIVIGITIIIGARVLVSVIINTLQATGTVNSTIIQSVQNAAKTQ